MILLSLLSFLCCLRSIAAHVIIILSMALFSIPLALQPLSAQGQIKLDTISNQGTFRVEITWMPNNIGSPNTLDVRFVDPDTGTEIEDIKYDITIYNDNGIETTMKGQESAFQEVYFESEGSYEIGIEDIDDLGEGVRIPILVTPEFRWIDLSLFYSIVITVAVIAARASVSGDTDNNLFRQSAN